MKKKIMLITAGLLLNAAAIFANQIPPIASRLLVNIQLSTNPTSVEVRLANLEKKGTLLLLQDLSGNQWFAQFVWRKHGFAKKLNFKGMPDGAYTLTVKHPDATVIQVVRLSKGVLELSEQQRLEMPAEPGKDLVNRK